MLNWANRFNICCFLDNHQYHSPHNSIECLAGIDAVQLFQPQENCLAALRSMYCETNDWLFGHINYDLKNEIYAQTSILPDRMGFPLISFFRPETVLQLDHTSLHISCIHRNPQEVFEQIMSAEIQTVQENLSVACLPRMKKEEYIDAIGKIREHILRGDCYELNFCQEFFASSVQVNTLQLYQQLTSVSPNPFSCYYKLDDRYLLCASPERFLQKKGNHILSQPIKGTFKRDLQDPVADEKWKQQLAESEKDRSENVMVVDLVRNDLSRICKEGTVQVDELFGIYSFPQVHQMISTISGELENDMDLASILQACFPMGSMTGAPKKKVVELIEKYEASSRGIYSGAVGYISPEKDFDFNVVIRSILYNAADNYLSYLVGGGITFYSDAEKEYEECLLKAKAIQQVLGGK